MGGSNRFPLYKDVKEIYKQALRRLGAMSDDELIAFVITSGQPSPPNKELIEARFKESLDAWVQSARPTGDFLNAVLCNDLREAIGRGDGKSLANLPHIVSYLYNECPANCWGDKQTVESWEGGGTLETP